MNKMLQDILDEIDHNWKCLPIDFDDESWRENIPSKPGWYLIKTSTPLKKLKSLKSINFPEHKAHTNIPQAINSASLLQNHGLIITQSGNEDYVVYNGEAANLKYRAREHQHGHPNTACLGLSDYRISDRYRWTFCYVAVSSCRIVTSVDNKLLRVAIEQGWRASHGWPILCRK
jgi:hypothetical protein